MKKQLSHLCQLGSSGTCFPAMKQETRKIEISSRTTALCRQQKNCYERTARRRQFFNLFNIKQRNHYATSLHDLLWPSSQMKATLNRSTFSREIIINFHTYYGRAAKWNSLFKQVNFQQKKKYWLAKNGRNISRIMTVFL